MNQWILSFPLLLSIFCYVEAQSSPPQNSVASFQPTIAAVLGVLVVMFFLTILLSIYTLYCHGRTTASNNNQQTPEVLESPIQRSSGVDRIVIESLPFFKFSALRGLKGGLECSVCLSKFEDIEVLRLLPKCKHAFHINCVDKWLENHSSCPLCRQRICVQDLTCSISSRFLLSQRAESNIELFVQREEEDSRQQGSSVFRIGSSLRKLEKDVVKEDELPIREACEGLEEDDKFLHRFNHKIILSGSVFKTRWSNLSSSDLLFLNSEMLGDVSSNRFPLLDSNTSGNSHTLVIEEGGMSNFRTNVDKLHQNDSYPLSSGADTSKPLRNLLPNEKRSMSERVVHSRFKDLDTRNDSNRESSVPENAAEEERLKRLWLSIARKTVQWYGNRDHKYKPSNYTKQSLDA